MSTIPLKYSIRAMAGTFFRRRMKREKGIFLDAAGNRCRNEQRELLRRLLHLNGNSAFSQDHGLSPSMSLDQFRAAVPVSDYELVRPYINRVASGEQQALLGHSNRLQMFAVTSGTTAESKLIPITEHFLRDYRRGWQMWGAGAYAQHRVLQKLNIVQITSSHRRFCTSGGIPCGNISGLVATMQNLVVRTLYTIPAAVAEISDSETRRYVVLRLALTDPYIGMFITANPGTLLQLIDTATSRSEELLRDIRDGGLRGSGLPDHVRAFFRNCLRAAPDRARELEAILKQHGFFRPRLCWPLLGLLGVWCGGSAGAYIPRLKSVFDELPVRDHGLHASEGRMTLPMGDNTPAGLLEIQTHFFEFIPIRESDSVNPVVLEAHELTEGDEYLILLTTSSGLYRYNIRDVVRCVGHVGQTPILEFLHKGDHISSITGEKIAESQVVEAVCRADVAHQLRPRLYTMTSRWGNPPGYVLYLQLHETNAGSTRQNSESDREEQSARDRLFAASVDEALSELNIEYREKRSTGRLAPLEVIVLDDQQWSRFSQRRQAECGGSPEQYKHPCLLPDPGFEDRFRKCCGLDT